MGTFHDNLGELHGITVAVLTSDRSAFVGRCHEANDHHVILLDADSHTDGQDGLSNNDWIRRAAKWGVFPNHRTISLHTAEVTSITPLNQIDAA